jgi:hypothetical protein
MIDSDSASASPSVSDGFSLQIGTLDDSLLAPARVLLKKSSVNRRRLDSSSARAQATAVPDEPQHRGPRERGGGDHLEPAPADELLHPVDLRGRAREHGLIVKEPLQVAASAATVS